MMHHPAEETLHCLVDGELSDTSRAETERHVAACAQCGDLVASLERLRRTMAQLPRSIEPPAHVAAALQAQLATRPVRRRRGWHAGLAAAAAVIVVAAGVLLVQRQSSPDIPPVVAVDSERDRRLHADLRNELERQRHLLAPQTIAVVEDDLRMIDEAIVATEKALLDDPSNAQLSEMLDDTRRRRSDYLESALELASE